ncbi:MAG TPA: PilC/PilY family type IV pilus protein [Myxococcota bacterium]|nr:PilC/PilY family type IV pilus protein [Myxococcota bacterium]
MKGIKTASSLAAALLMTFVAGDAAMAKKVQFFDSPVPTVQILLDTSGSMQYDVNPSPYEEGDEQPELLPACSNVSGMSGKSRYTLATEILAGTIENYSCEIQDRSSNQSPYCPGKDCYTDEPHVQANGTRATNGLIDTLGANARFGIMTMDSDPHHSSGASGDFSYGGEKFGKGNGKFNYGAQNSHSPIGRLVLPAESSDPDDILARNAQVKASLLSARPHGGTPIGAMFYDALAMARSEPGLANDAYDSCRRKHVVLLTDGRSNTGDGEGGYPDPVEAAQDMREEGYEVWVVQFGVAEGVTSQAYDIATYHGLLPDDHFMMAADASSLASALGSVMSVDTTSTQSRTGIVITEQTGNTTDVQYQFNAAYRNVNAPAGAADVDVLSGVLERSVYQCGVDVDQLDSAGLATIQSIGDKLNLTPDGSRNIYTMVDGDLQSFVWTNVTITNDMLDAPNPLVEPVPDFGLDVNTDWCAQGTIGGFALQKVLKWRQNLFSYIRASEESCRSGYKLGGIVHSTPALQDTLKGVSLSIPSFAAYKASIASRPHMLYTCTHDGMLHAFRTDRPSGSSEPDSWGKELWAYIPGHQLDVLRTVPELGETALDGAPVLADIVLSRTFTSRATENEDSWKSVLLFGDRAGGAGYTALDVTDPTDGNWSVLWEISAEEGRCPGGSNMCNPGGIGNFRNNYSRLGKSYGKPVIGTVMICPSVSGSCTQKQLEEVAVAVIPGGSSEGMTTLGSARTAFVVRLDNGEKLAEFATGNIDGDFANVRGDCNGNTSLVEADITGDMSCLSTVPGTFLTRCYVGDSAGRLWKLEIGSASRSSWTMTMFYDPYDMEGMDIPLNDPIRAPVYEAPAISLTSTTNEPVIVYGGGDVDDLLNTAQKAFIVSITDTVTSTIPNPPSPWDDDLCFRSLGADQFNGPKLNWKSFLGYDSSLAIIPGEPAGIRLMGQPIIYGGVTYFTTYIPQADNACSMGSGRVYGLDYVLTDGAGDVPRPRLPDESDPYTYEPYQEIGCAETPAVPYGVQVASRPSCIGGESIYDAGIGSGSGTAFGSTGSSQPQLIIQTGLNTGEENEHPADGSTNRSINQIVRSMVQVIESILVNTWGSVFD